MKEHQFDPNITDKPREIQSCRSTPERDDIGTSEHVRIMQDAMQLTDASTAEMAVVWVTPVGRRVVMRRSSNTYEQQCLGSVQTAWFVQDCLNN